MRRTGRDRRDWSLLIFVVPLGILLMILAGQLAMRIVPWWILNANMGSALSLNGRPVPIPLFSMQILTPFAWQDTYLTPSDGGGFVFPPFIVIEPSVVAATLRPETSGVTSTPAAPIPTTTQRSTATVYIPPPLKTATNNPANLITGTNTTTPTVTATPTITATPTVTATPTITATPTTTATATTTATPTTTATATPTVTLTLAPTGYPSTPDPVWGTPYPPIDINGPDGTNGSIPQGSYTVVDLGLNPVIIYGTLDANIYELVFYESESLSVPGNIFLDNIIIGISNDPLGSSFYKVFDWGDGITDFNTNISGWPEVDNQVIPTSSLYNVTGILIDADNAASEPPPIFGGYRYLVIVAPVKPPPDSYTTESIEVDAIEVWP